MQNVKQSLKPLLSLLLAMLVFLAVLPVPASAASPTTGDLEITVTDPANGMPAGNAIFQLELSGATVGVTPGATPGTYDHGGATTQIAVFNGKAYVNDLTPGTYTLRQISATSGYAMDATPARTVTLFATAKSDAYFQQVYASNPGTTPGVPSWPGSPVVGTGGSIIVTVTDASTGNGIAGAKIDIYDGNNALIETLTTDSYGDAFSRSLPAGTYFVRQTGAVGNYEANNQRNTVTINSGSVTLQLTNKPKTADIRVIAVNHSGERVSGVGFSISGGNSKGASISTDANGEAYATGLEQGSYTVSCVSVPEGYTRSHESRSVQIGNDVYFYLSQQTYKISFYVTDAKENPLPNIKVGIWNEGGGKLADVATDEDGYATYNGIAVGSYYATIKTAVWRGEQSRYKFSIATKNPVTSLDLVALPRTGTLQITVLDGGGDEVENASIEIFNSKKKKIATVKTDEDGLYCDEECPVGTYYVRTKSSSKNKKKTYAEITITANDTSDVVLRNKAGEKGTVIVYYKHKDTNQELSASRSYTDNVGVDYSKWLKSTKSDKKNIPGYTFVEAEYPESTKLTDEVQEVVYWYTGNKASKK